MDINITDLWPLLKTVTNCALILCQKITVTKLRPSSYGVVVKEIVSKGKTSKEKYLAQE